jgi:CRP/FNR family cyclic AMP-dependent transcriptional regulator
MGRMAHPAADASVALGALRACRLFRDLDEDSLALVAGALRPRRFRRDETIFHAGDPGEALFIVADGQVKITLPPDDGSEPAILTAIGPGGFFGELALLDGAPRSATAVALGSVATQVLHRDTFDRLVDTQPTLRHALLTSLAAEIRRLTSQVEDLHFLDLPGRLARRILRMLEDVHGPTDRVDGAGGANTGERRLPWPYTQTELAGMIGGSRQSVNRLLAELVARDLLRFDGDELVIPDPDRLMAAARR